jgi:spore maturation protein CgeB
MKQRIFETTAGAGVLVTEYHPGIEEYFEINKEIITFETTREFREKVTFLQNKPQIAEKLAKAGHERFLKEHDSKIRLSRVLEEIMAI